MGVRLQHEDYPHDQGDYEGAHEDNMRCKGKLCCAEANLSPLLTICLRELYTP